mgnify:CR=1 FL=1
MNYMSNISISFSSFLIQLLGMRYGLCFLFHKKNYELLHRFLYNIQLIKITFKSY